MIYIQHTTQRFGFHKYGITVFIDESKHHNINIRGLDNYRFESSVEVSSTSEMDNSDIFDSDSDESTASSRLIIFGIETVD